MKEKLTKKKSSDYGLFAVRLSNSERKELIALLDNAKTRLNKNRKGAEFVIKKNEILIEAIKRGIHLVEKKDLRK